MEQTSGLRFDIYERVQLSEENEDIGQLEEIELVPSIELNVKDTQAVLSGHLQLSGSYNNLRSDQQQQLEHRIPVEITLPLSRIKNADNIDIEIENFDVELLSARTLNVTGVLSLSGLELNRPESVNWANEEAVFVHEKTAAPLAAEDSRAEQEESPDIHIASAESRNTPLSGESQPFAARSFAQPSSSSEDARTEPEQSDAAQTSAPAQSQVSETKREEAAKPEAEVKSAAAEKADVAENVQAEPVTALSDQQVAEEIDPSEVLEQDAKTEEPSEPADEVKIAFTKKENDVSNAFTKNLTSLLKRPNEDNNLETELNAEEAAEAPAAEQEHAGQEAEGAEREEESASGSENGLEWKKLFLSQDEDETNRFSKLKMCIVQKDETLETIAERYQLNPREILLYNRLSDHSNVTEGQIVYIPQVQE